MAGAHPSWRASNEIVHELDIFPTIAAAAGADIVPKDRAIDGVNQLPLLEGRQKTSSRESALFFTGNGVRAVKWKDWKFHYAFMPEPRVTEPAAHAPVQPEVGPARESDVKDANPWAIGLFDKLVADFTASTERHPNVPSTAKDPYAPPRRP